MLEIVVIQFTLDKKAIENELQYRCDRLIEGWNGDDSLLPNDAIYLLRIQKWELFKDIISEAVVKSDKDLEIILKMVKDNKEFLEKFALINTLIAKL